MYTNELLKLYDPKIKYGQNKRQINEIIDLNSRKKLNRVNKYI